METGTAIKKELPFNNRILRLRIAELISSVGASHVGSCFSMVEILNAVYRCVDVKKIQTVDEGRDRVIVSKGHSAAGVYTIMAEHGLMERETLESYGKNGSLLSGHVNHFVPYIEHSTGALGHGLSVGVGICIGLKAKGHKEALCFVIVGDGELHEGSNWEALMLAGHLKLNNFCVIVDNNCLGGVCHTSKTCCLSPLALKFQSFGFEVQEVDGHDEQEIMAGIKALKLSSKPGVIIARTIKGKGASFMEGQNVWHYRPPKKEDCERLKLEFFGEKGL